jgi:hypothetical protein
MVHQSFAAPAILNLVLCAATTVRQGLAIS